MSAERPSKKCFDDMLKLYGENKEVNYDYDKSLSVKCENGTFVGKLKNDVISFKGIPFAKPPINENRWKAPLYVDKSEKVYEAYYFGKTAIQEPLFSERASCYPQSEDCLYLNVWTSKKITSNKTVMVFIHGGSYGYGGTSDPIYDGQNFVEAHPDIVLVTITYRVGIMGFIDFSFVEGSEGYEDSPNLGILDQIMALRYINNNIAAFGGDKDNITIFGESAGGGSVSILPVVKEAKGLFKRAIGESGSIALTYNRKECEAFTREFMKLTNSKNMQDLLKLTTEEIQKANAPINEKNNFPLRDGKLIPENLYKAYRNGESAWCDMINGTNKDECRYWIGELGGKEAYALAIPVLFSNQMELMEENDKKRADSYYKGSNNGLGYAKITEFENDLIFRCPAQMQLRLHAMNGGKSYNYFWTYESDKEDYGACHAVELNHVFNNLNERIYTGENVNKELATEVQNMWVNFAKTGDPSTEKHQWPLYDAKTKKTMMLGEKIYVKENLYSRRSAIVDPILKYLINGNYSVLKVNTTYVWGTLITTLVIVAIVVLSIILLVLKYIGGY